MLSARAGGAGAVRTAAEDRTPVSSKDAESSSTLRLRARAFARSSRARSSEQAASDPGPPAASRPEPPGTKEDVKRETTVNYSQTGKSSKPVQELMSASVIRRHSSGNTREEDCEYHSMDDCSASRDSGTSRPHRQQLRLALSYSRWRHQRQNICPQRTLRGHTASAKQEEQSE